MIRTKAFYELMDIFERTVCPNKRLDREKGDNIPARCFYQDGEVNNLFFAFLAGYQLHESMMVGEL